MVFKYVATLLLYALIDTEAQEQIFANCVHSVLFYGYTISRRALQGCLNIRF